MKKIKKPLIILRCGKCGEFLELITKKENYKDEDGKKKTKSEKKLICPNCDKSY